MTAAVESLLRQWGVEPTIVFAGAGVGVALMPCLTVDLDDRRTVFVDVRGKLPPRGGDGAWHRDRYRPASSRAFVAAATPLSGRLENERSNPSRGGSA